MRIVSISEDKKTEKRIAITPDIAKKYISNGFEVLNVLLNRNQVQDRIKGLYLKRFDL